MLGFHERLTLCCVVVPEPVTDINAAVVPLFPNITFADAVPELCGAKITEKGCDWPDASVKGKEMPESWNSPLLEVPEETVTLEFEAVKVPDKVALEPTATLPKTKDAGRTPSCPPAAVVPDSGIMSPVLPRREVIVMLPATVALVVGVKITVKV